MTDNTGNVTGSTQTVALTGTGLFIYAHAHHLHHLFGYLGSAKPAYSGASQVLPLNAYLPTGASGITYFETSLVSVSGGATEYTIYVVSNDAGGYTLNLNNGTANAPAWPYPTLSATGATITLSTPITLGTLSITAYNFSVVGNQMTLNLTVNRTGTFDDNVVVIAIAGNNYSSPWYGVDGSWSSSSTSAPAITLSPTSLNFGSQSVGTSVSQNITVTNSGTAALTISSATLSGTNSADFTVADGCTSSVAPGGTCTIGVTFDAASAGSPPPRYRSPITFRVRRKPSRSPVPVHRTQRPRSSPPISVHMAVRNRLIAGASQVLPLNAYLPTGASGITYFETSLVSVSGGATEYTIYVVSNGAGSYTMNLSNGTANAPAWPYPTLSATGTNVTLSTPITLGTLSITAYNFSGGWQSNDVESHGQPHRNI